jgi:hypothetical protein
MDYYSDRYIGDYRVGYAVSTLYEDQIKQKKLKII